MRIPGPALPTKGVAAVGTGAESGLCHGVKRGAWGVRRGAVITLPSASLATGHCQWPLFSRHSPLFSPILRPPSYRQRLFVKYYLGESSGSAVDAARRVGYSTPLPDGVNMLRNATIYDSDRSSWSLVFGAS